jgi:hypothetical protein
MLKRNVLNSPRLLELKKKRRKAFLSKVVIIVIALFVLAGSCAYFSRLDGLNIKEIKVEGNKVVDESVIVEAVNSELAGKYAFLYPKTNVLIYPEMDIKNSLLEKFPRLASVDLDATDRKTLFINVSEREAKYMWCGEKMPLSVNVESLRTEEKCYFMDEEGYIFDEAPYFSGEVYFKFYGGGGDENPEGASPAGSHFAPGNFKQLETFKDVLAGMGLKPVVMHILDEEDVEIYLARSGLGMGPKIIFRSSADLKNTAENLQAALTTDPLMSGFKNKYAKLEYIDIRFGNKVYFKFND